MEKKSTEVEALFNLEEIRRHAMTSMNQGAVTGDYPLDIEKACQLLNEALATEILCVLRYRHHAVIAKGINAPYVAEEFKEHAANEDEHVWALAVRIDQLGGNPDFNPETIKTRTATEYGAATDLTDMIREDLVAERTVIEVYRQMIAWFGHNDPTTRRLLEKILADEEEHANELADLLVVSSRKTLN
ncbi:MAG: bacterioferritin [Pseudobdellovibrio sp.]|nr:bacterioferritin [Pseudobdellovibrio sp.]